MSLTCGKGINPCFHFYLRYTELSAPSQSSADDRKQTMKIMNVYVNPSTADNSNRLLNFFL